MREANAEVSPVREVLSIALPSAVGLLSYAVMQAVDTALLGRYSTVDQAGAGITAIAVWALMCPVLGTMSAIATFSAQYTGAGRYRRAGRHLRSALLMSLVVTVPYAGLALLGPEIVGRFGTDPDVARAGGAYLQIRLFGTVFVAISMGASSFLRGTGDAVTPLKVSLAANTLNLGLDWILIFGRLGLPAMGVQGAALATVSAQAFEAACFVFLFFSRRALREDYRIGIRGRIAWTEVRRLLRVGGPVGAYWVTEAGAWASFIILLGTFKSKAVVAATYASFQITHLSFLPVVGLLVAAQAVVGKYMGRLDPVTARRRGFLCMGMGTVFMTVAGVIMFAFRSFLIGLFNPDPEVIRLGAMMMVWVAVMQPFDAVSMTMIGALRGAGDTLFAFCLMAVAAWGLFLPVTWIITQPLGGGPATAWLGAIVYMAFLAAVTVWRWRGRAWETRRI